MPGALTAATLQLTPGMQCLLMLTSTRKVTWPNWVEDDASARPPSLFLALCVQLFATQLLWQNGHLLQCVPARFARNSCTVLEKSRQKGFLWPLSALHDLDRWPPDPKSWSFHALTQWNTCAKLHRNQLIHFQGIMFTSFVMDKWMGGLMNKPRTQCLCRPVWLGRGVKGNNDNNHNILTAV